jgi:Uma2 family endonuclease
VCVYLTRPQGYYPTTPPFLSIDVLSPDDYFQDFWEKQEDFSNMGVPNVWIIDPYRKKLYNFDGRSMSSVSELVTHDPHVLLTKADVFERSFGLT